MVGKMTAIGIGASLYPHTDKSDPLLIIVFFRDYYIRESVLFMSLTISQRSLI